MPMDIFRKKMTSITKYILKLVSFFPSFGMTTVKSILKYGKHENQDKFSIYASFFMTINLMVVAYLTTIFNYEQNIQKNGSCYLFSRRELNIRVKHSLFLSFVTFGELNEA
tara:strand:+ start:746 stop:1078 length:333 start_codon:yes stop_codon:yes gene_type:complete